MSKGPSMDRFSSGELSALLDEDCDGHRLAEFLLKKHGGTTRPKRIFAAYKPERFSIDVRTEKIKTPTRQTNASPKTTTTTTTTNNDMQLHVDVAKKQRATNEGVPLDEQQNGSASVPILPTASPSLQTVNIPVPIRSSPSERLSIRRSVAMPSADRLRRFSLKRLSTMSVGRKLLEEFDSTLTNSKFLPKICSTPMTHLPNISPADQSPCISKKLEDKLAKAVQKGATPMIPSSSTDTHNNTDRILNSLLQHEAALNHILEHDSDKTIKQILEKENLYRNTANTPPLTHKQSDQRSRLTSPIFNQRSRPTTPLSSQRSRSTTPVSNQRSRPTTPVSNQHSRPTTPVSNQCSRPTTPDCIRRRTYTVEKGSQPGQVVLTPAKSPPAQQQQPTSTTVEDGLLPLPSSPVEEAVYDLHTINLATPDSPTSAHLLPVQPLLASPKILRVMERNVASNNPQPASGFKLISKKKSRIPLMTPAAKLKCNTAHIEVPNTPEINVNITRTHAVIPEKQEDSDVDIPETQDLPMETQKILETLQKNRSVTPMIVIPIHQTFNHTPTQSHETTNDKRQVEAKVNKTTTTPVNIEADTTMRQLTSNKAKKVDKKSTTSARSSESLLIESPTPQMIANEDNMRLCDILTDDEDDQILHISRTNRQPVSSKNSQMESSNVPLNLALQSQTPLQQSGSHSSSATRSRRFRKRSTRRSQQQQTKLSPLLSTETESEIGPPRAHPLITRHTSVRQSRKIPLNAAPNTPINGERFAVEMKTYLARLNNREILDLRIRNSLGKVFDKSGRRKSSLGRKCSLSAKQALEKQLQLEEEIQMEILKRNLNDEGDGEGLQPHSPEPVTAAEEEVVEQVYDAPDVETEQIYELPNEEAELLHTIPPAPENFRDITTHQSLAHSSFLWRSKDYTESSLVDDNSSGQVKFVSNDISKKSTQTKSTKRRGKRSKKPVPEVMQKYMEISNSKIKKTTYVNQSKRGLYSQENEISNMVNSSFEQDKSPPEKSSAATTRVEQQQKQQLEKTSHLSTSNRRSEHPLPPPDSFADELAHTTAAKSMAVSTVAGTSVANDMDNNLFKKPKNPAPIAKKTKKTNRGEVKKKNASDVIESFTTVPNDETSTLRRSKRGPKPLKNYWSFRSTDPMPLYDVAILEKRREEAKKLREMRSQNSKAIITGENFTMSTASSTSSSTKKRGRPTKPINFLGDTDSSSAASVTFAPRRKRLTMVQEIENQPVTVSEQMYQDLNLGDNMFNRLDEVDISASKTHKVSRTPQKNNSPTSKTIGDVEKVAKKRATKNATKQKKATTKKSTKVSTEEKSDEALINVTHESTQHLAVHSHTAAHINDIFDKLKSGITANTTTPTTNPPNLTNSIPSTARKCRIRLSRLKVPEVSKSKKTSSNSKKSSKVNLTSSVTNYGESMSSNAPSWLRDISHVGSKILMDTDKEKEMFEQMLLSQPDNLVLTAIDGLDYVYYENNKEIPFGYMRFQPNQAKPLKRARHYDLRFFVLSGKFKICTNKDIATFSEGSVVTILKGSSYSITNITDKLAILMVFKNQDH